MRRRPLLACLATAAAFAAETPALPPRIALQAAFAERPRCPVYDPGETVRLRARVSGHRHQDDRLLWSATDWQGSVVANGELAVTKGAADWEGVIAPGDLGAGCFQLHLRLERPDITLPRTGTQPAGMVSYAVLPAIETLPLERVDASRFGAQGDFTPDASLWRRLGLRWAYRDRRPYDIANQGPGSYVPQLDPAQARAAVRQQAEQGMCLFVDAHSLPPWLTDLPAGTDTGAWTPSATTWWQSYPPSDHAAYGALLGRIAAEQAVERRAAFPTQRHGYYEIHWEPDWHWKGTDEAFIRMYQTARAAIRANDPQGLLLGANYGVIDTGNRHLERLLAKGLGRHLDGLVTHTYYLPMIHRSPEQAGLVGEVRRLVAMARTHLPAGAPIINSEWGIHCGDSFGRRPVEDPSVLRREAAWLLRGHLITLGEGVDTTFFFYTIDHTDQGGWGLLYNLTYPYPAFRPEWVAPKPAFSAVAAATRLLEGTRSLGAIDYLGEGVLGYAFERGGRRVAALWSSDEADRTVDLPCGIGRMTVYDAVGNAREIQAVDGVCPVRLGAAPVYVAGLSPAALPGGAAIAASTATVGAVLAPAAPLAAGERLVLHAAGGRLPSSADGAIALPRGLRPGRWLLTRHGADGAVMASQAVDVHAPFTVALARQTGADPLLVTVANQGSEALPVAIEVIDDAGTVRHAQQVGVAAGASVARTVPQAALPEGAASREPVVVRVVDGHGVAVVGRIELERRFQAARLGRRPAGDGTLSGWLQESFHRVEGAAAVKIEPGRWSGPQDLSFRYAIGWDDRALLLAVAVRDPSHLQTRSAIEAWQQDSLQIGIGLERDPQQGWRRFHKLCFARSSKDGGILAYRHCGTGDRPPGTLAGRPVSCAIRRLGDETRYELAIPWSELDAALAGPPAAAELGLGLLVNSVGTGPTGPTPRMAMEAFGGMAEQRLHDLGVVDLR